ncbi:C-C motif chemokine 20 [Ambystoma mexicanum]|uniref:C-C motif chemokine 20 n=1 Tax=Ambystoma mexicanum TaxID=8296 RepID=UPI0037E79D4E
MAALNSPCVLLTLCVVLGLLHLESCAQSSGYLDCCYTYTKKLLRMKDISNFTMQRSSGVCDMDAIIFHTKENFNVCANPEDPWVKSILKAFGKNKKSKGKRIPGKRRKAGSRKQG